MNDFTPLLTKRLPGGLPPSGKSFAEILSVVRKEVYEAYEDIAQKKSKAVNGLRGYVVSSRVGDVCYLRRSVSAIR